jgi:hypothetical protein
MTYFSVGSDEIDPVSAYEEASCDLLQADRRRFLASRRYFDRVAAISPTQRGLLQASSRLLLHPLQLFFNLHIHRLDADILQLTLTCYGSPILF